MVSYINPANQAPWVQTSHPRESLAPIDLQWEQQKIFFSEIMRPTAYIFSVQQCLVVPYINPANQDPGVKTGHGSGVISSHRLTKEKT